MSASGCITRILFIPVVGTPMSVEPSVNMLEALNGSMADIKDECHRSVLKLDDISETTEGTATTVRDIQMTVLASKNDFQQLRTEVMEVETKTAEEIKVELNLRRTKIDDIRVNTDGLVSSVKAVQQTVDEIKGELATVKAVVSKDNLAVMIQEISSDLKIAGTTLKVIDKNTKDGAAQLTEVKGDVASVRSEVDSLKGDIG